MSEPESAVLDALYQGAFDNAALEQALRLLTERLSCVSAVIVSTDVQAPGTAAVAVTGRFVEGAAAYAARYGAIDPAPAAFARLPPGRASTTGRILDEAAFASEFFHEFYRPLGLVETLGANLLADKARWALIGLHRDGSREPFEDDEIAYIERLAPHVTRALQLRRSFAQLDARTAGLEAAVDRLAAGIIILDAGGGGLFVNRAMRAIAERGDGLSLDRNGLPLPLAHDARLRLSGLIRDVAGGGAGGLATVPRSGGGRPYAVLVAPSPPPVAEGVWDRLGRPRILVLVHDPAAGHSATDLLREALGLTAGAARLLAALAAADDLQTFALREGITIHTARFHLRTALARTGARTQVELVRLAVGLLRDLGTQG